MDPNQHLRRCIRKLTWAYFSGACGLFSYLDDGDASLQSLALCHLDVDSSRDQIKGRTCSSDSS